MYPHSRTGLLAVLAALFSSSVFAVTDVLMYHADQASTGQYLTETVLSGTNVNSTNFGKLFSYSVDGQVYAQPLYKSAVPITTGSYSGTTRNVVFVATENDSVYAFDADGSAGASPLWQVSFLTGTNVTPVPSGDTGSGDLTPQIGITSTPVIDPTTNTLFVVAKTKEVISGSNHYVFRFHALDIGSGTEKAGSPVVLADTIYTGSAYTYVSGPTVSGTGAGAVGNQVTYNALRSHQRPALALSNGVVYVASSSHSDNGPYHGWIIGFSSTTYQIVAAWNTCPNGSQGGIWEGGGGLPVDSSGNIYCMTGNGSFTQPTFDTPTSSYINGAYGDSFVKLTVDTVHNSSTNQNSNGWGLKVTGYFTPYNQGGLSSNDLDLGSGGPTLLPDSAGSTAHPHLMVGGGKGGTLYLVDRDNMGGYSSTSDVMLQEITGAFGRSYNTPGYFNGVVYYGGGWGTDPGHSFTVSSGSITASKNTPDTFGFPGASPWISGTGPNDPNAIVWCLDNGNGSNQLRAYLASNYSTEIYTTAQAANNRDQVTGNSPKFAVPIVANTRVYVPTMSGLIVYGLINGPATVLPAAPTNLAATGVNGSVISLTWTDNSNNEAGFYIEQSPDGVNFTQIGSVGSNIATYPVTGLQAATKYYFRVRAYNVIGDSAYTNIANATTISGSPLVDFSTGFSSAGTTISLNNSDSNGSPVYVGSALELTDGTNNEDRSAFYKTEVNISQFQTQWDVLVSGTDNNADGYTFCIQTGSATAIGGFGGGLGYSGINGSKADSMAIKFNLYSNVSQTGLYTSGTSPSTTTGLDTTASGVNFHAGHILRNVLVYNGTALNQTITDLSTNAVFSTSYTINIPTVVSGSMAYIGFTAGTGGSNSIQQILDWSFTIPPAAPTTLTVTANSGTQLTLTWANNSSDESGYAIQRANDSAFTVNAATFFGPPVTSGSGTYMDTNLIEGTQYYYRVYATNAAGNSGYSNVVNITMPTPPITPSNLHATFISTSAIDLLWNDNSNNENGFYLYVVNVNTGVGSLIATLPANTTSYNDINLAAGTDFNFHLQAFNAAGYTDFTGDEVTTLCAAPSSPSASPGASMVTLLWSAPTGAASYNIYRSTSSGGEGSTPYQMGITSASFVDSAVTSGSTYYYEITALNDNGLEGPPSSEVFATPTNPVVSIATNTSPAQEDTATGGSFTLSRTGGTTGALPVSLTIQTGAGQAASTRYTLSPAPPSVTIPAGQSFVTITVTPKTDITLLGTQSVTLNIGSGSGYGIGTPTTATVALLDTPYNMWKIQQFGGLSAAQSASDTASAAGDGISNLMKYALGIAAGAQGASALPVSNVQNVDGGTYLTITFTVAKPAPTDITYIVETTPDITSGTWSPATAVTGYPQDNGNGTQTMLYRDIVQQSGTHMHGFIRLRVTRP